MRSKTEERNGGRETGVHVDAPDFKWAVEWLVRRRGQRRAASLLGVDRKTVALALRRERLTARMNHAVQTLLANLDDPAKQEVMPLDRMESQIGLLLESMEELEGLVGRLTQRVEALEEERAQMEEQADAEHPVVAGREGAEALEPETDQIGRPGWWRS